MVHQAEPRVRNLYFTYLFCLWAVVVEWGHCFRDCHNSCYSAVFAIKSEHHFSLINPNGISGFLFDSINTLMGDI